MESEDRIQDVEPRRKGCFGCFFTGLLGCAAFLIGSLTAALLFAPQLLGDLVAVGLERSVNRTIDGELRIDALELAWTRRQRADVLLLDPAGREVLVVDAELPSLLALLDLDESSDLFHFDVGRAEIVVDDAGVTNLERSLGRDGALPDYGAWTSEVQWDHSDLQRAAFRVRLSGDQISWEDRRFPGRVARFGNLELAVAHEGPRRFTIEGSVEVEGEPAGRATLDGVLGGWKDGRWTEVEAEVRATALPTAALDLLAGTAGRLEEALGSPLEVTADIHGNTDEGAPLAVHVVGAGERRADLSARLLRDEVQAEGAGLSATLLVPESLCEAPLSALLPEGVALAREDPSAAWRVTARGFTIPLRLVSEGALAAGFALDAKVLPGTGLVLVGGGGARTALDHPGARIAVAPDTPPRLEILAGVTLPAGDGPRESRAFVALSGRPLLAPLGSGPPPRAGRFRAVAIEVEAPVLPARVLDVFLGREGRFEEAFGPVLQLSAKVPAEDAEGERLELVVVSPRASLQWSGVVAGGVVTAGAGGFRVRAPIGTDLGRLAAERFVPWLRPVPGTGDATARLLVDDLVVATTFEPATVSGRARLDFDRLAYRYAGGLEGLIEGGSERARTDPPEPLTVSIAAGIVTYAGVPVALGGRPCAVSGALDLGTDRVDLEIRAPMSIFVSSLGLDPAVADALDPGLDVPIQVSGTTTEPRVSVGMQAFTSLLQGGLEGLLGTTGGRLLRDALVEGHPDAAADDRDDE